MSLLQAKQLVWDEIIEDMEKNWELVNMVHEHKITVKDFEYSIMTTKEDVIKNSHVVEKFIKFVNERPLSDLRPIYVVDRVGAIMQITKMIWKEEAILSAKEFLRVVEGKVDALNKGFEALIRVGLRNGWELGE